MSFCLLPNGDIRLNEVATCRVKGSETKGRYVLILWPTGRLQSIFLFRSRSIRAHVRFCIGKRINSAFFFNNFCRYIRRVRVMCFQFRFVIRRNFRDNRFKVRSSGKNYSPYFTGIKAFVNCNRYRVIDIVLLGNFNCFMQAYSVDEHFRRTRRFDFQFRRQTMIVRINCRDSRICFRSNFICFRFRFFQGRIRARITKTFCRSSFVSRFLGCV